jgi:hypothetical protein
MVSRKEGCVKLDIAYRMACNAAKVRYGSGWRARQLSCLALDGEGDYCCSNPVVMGCVECEFVRSMHAC